jgi:hypothetical protein
MGCGDGGCEIVGDDSGIGDTQGDAFRWNRESKQVVGAEFWISVFDGSPEGWADHLGIVSHSYGKWIKKAAEDIRTRRSNSTTV